MKAEFFSARIAPEKFKNATVICQFGLVFVVFVKIIVSISCPKAPFLKCFPSTQKRKACVFKFLRFEERFRKVPFSWRISVDGRLNHGNKTAFSNWLGVVWMLPKLIVHKYIGVCNYKAVSGASVPC